VWVPKYFERALSKFGETSRTTASFLLLS